MSQFIDTPVPWWQVMAIGRNPRTTLVRLAITLVLVFVGFRMSIQPILVQGISMQPTYRDGQRRFLNKLAYRSAQPQRGDVIGIREAGKQVLLLKRVIALPGERLRIVQGTVLINGEPLEEPYLLPPTNGVQTQPGGISKKSDCRRMNSMSSATTDPCARATTTLGS